MLSKRKSKRQIDEMACPKSLAAVGRCSAGGPVQVRLKHPLGLLGPKNMLEARVRSVDVVYRYAHCGVVYISVGIPGMERILGVWTAHGFVPDASQSGDRL